LTEYADPHCYSARRQPVTYDRQKVAQKEMAFYESMMQPYGLPLDSRAHPTKTDWSLWTATLTDDQTDFESFIAPIYDYLDHTLLRVPLMDSYETDSLEQWLGADILRPASGGWGIHQDADGPGNLEKVEYSRPRKSRPFGAIAQTVKLIEFNKRQVWPQKWLPIAQPMISRGEDGFDGNQLHSKTITPHSCCR
jgi:Domain of unknown function (DUF1793)